MTVTQVCNPQAASEAGPVLGVHYDWTDPHGAIIFETGLEASPFADVNLSAFLEELGERSRDREQD